MIYFGENLRYLRKERNLKQAQIKAATGFSSTAWNNYENNVSYPKFLDLVKISEFFNISESDLIHKDLSSTAAEPRTEYQKPASKKEFEEVFQAAADFMEKQYQRELKRLERLLDDSNSERKEYRNLVIKYVKSFDGKTKAS